MNQEKYWQEYIKIYEKVMDITVLINDFLYPGEYTYKRIDQNMTLQQKQEHVANDMDSSDFPLLINYDLFENLEYYYPSNIDSTDSMIKLQKEIKTEILPILEKIYYNLHERLLPFIRNVTIQEYCIKNDKKVEGLKPDQVWELIVKEQSIINLLDGQIEVLITTMVEDYKACNINTLDGEVDEVLKQLYNMNDREYNRQMNQKKCSIIAKTKSSASTIECNFQSFDKYFKDMFGQDVAIKQIEKVLKRSILFHNAEDITKGKNAIKRGPLATFMFYGPTGTGKTQAAKIIADFVFSDKRKLLILDMNSYKDGKIGSSAIKGHPEGYVNSEVGTDFTRFLKNNNQGVIVLDEFEKADPSVREIFMTMIDEGEFKDALGNVYDMTSYIFIATTNANNKVVQRKKTIGFSVESKEKLIHQQQRDIKEELRETFTAPILNRFNNLVHFKKIEYDDAMDICANVITKLKDKFEGKRFNGKIPSITINDMEEICRYILRECEYEKDGVRSLKNVINDTIGSEIIEQILAKNYQISIGIKNDKIIVEKQKKNITLK